MIVKRDTQTHDLSDADATIEMSENIGDKKTFTCQLSWKDVDAGDTVVKLQGSNDKKNFDDLGIEKILTIGSGSATNAPVFIVIPFVLAIPMIDFLIVSPIILL